MADEAPAILLFICSHEFWVKLTYDWTTALCLFLCLCRPPAPAILLFICSHEFWVKLTYDWTTALCLFLCLCRPRFH